MSFDVAVMESRDGQLVSSERFGSGMTVRSWWIETAEHHDLPLIARFEVGSVLYEGVELQQMAAELDQLIEAWMADPRLVVIERDRGPDLIEHLIASAGVIRRAVDAAEAIGGTLWINS